MNKLKLFIAAIMMCLVTTGSAQTKASTQQNYYLYASIEVRWADKVTGEQCFVILMSPGENGQQRSLRKSENQLLTLKIEYYGIQENYYGRPYARQERPKI